jgi:hypothetical protein
MKVFSNILSFFKGNLEQGLVCRSALPKFEFTFGGCMGFSFNVEYKIEGILKASLQ